MVTVGKFGEILSADDWDLYFCGLLDNLPEDSPLLSHLHNGWPKVERLPGGSYVVWVLSVPTVSAYKAENRGRRVTKTVQGCERIPPGSGVVAICRDSTPHVLGYPVKDGEGADEKIVSALRKFLTR